MRLRGYRASDLEAMHALDVLCFEKPFRFSRSAMRRFAETSKARVIIAEQNDALLGFVILHLESADTGQIGYIVTLDVSPNHRRKGLARQLMLSAEQESLSKHCVALVLHVFTGNYTAIRFYESQDFVPSHLERNFYGPGTDAWVLHKLLNPPASSVNI